MAIGLAITTHPALRKEKWFCFACALVSMPVLTGSTSPLGREVSWWMDVSGAGAEIPAPSKKMQSRPSV